MKKLILIGFILLSSGVFAKVEHQVDKSKKNLVKFISDAPVEDFEGITSSIDGYMLGEEGNFIGTELYFEVQLNTVDTDNGLRNRHMRENYLHTDKYPLTTFEGKIFESKKIDDKHYEVKAKGKFQVHGVTKEKIIEADIYVYDNIYHVKTKFVVTLTDHKIEVPSLMLVKIDPDMDLRLDFFLKEVTK
jgi:polyisoprenoid-binding protein YceI